MRNETEMIEVSLNRLGTAEVIVLIPEDSTLQDALNKAGWSLLSNEKCYVEDIPASLTSILDDGDSIQVVGSKVGGIK